MKPRVAKRRREINCFTLNTIRYQSARYINLTGRGSERYNEVLYVCMAREALLCEMFCWSLPLPQGWLLVLNHPLISYTWLPIGDSTCVIYDMTGIWHINPFNIMNSSVTTTPKDMRNDSWNSIPLVENCFTEALIKIVIYPAVVVNPSLHRRRTLYVWVVSFVMCLFTL